jgi:hypothetical protein
MARLAMSDSNRSFRSCIRALRAMIWFVNQRLHPITSKTVTAANMPVTRVSELMGLGQAP